MIIKKGVNKFENLSNLKRGDGNRREVGFEKIDIFIFLFSLDFIMFK